MCRKETHTALK